MAMHRCYKVVADTAWSTDARTPLTALDAALVAGAVAGTVLPSWFARPVTDVPTVATAVPTPAATGATGLLPPEPGVAPEDPLPGDPLRGDPPTVDEGVPVVVAAPLRVTCPPGLFPEPRAPAGGDCKAKTPAPIAPVREPGAVGPIGAVPGVLARPWGRTVPCAPSADLIEGPWCASPAVTPATTSATTALRAAIVQYRPL
jgi:hypothetical protein